MAHVNVSVTGVLHLGCCECRHCQTTLAIAGAMDPYGRGKRERAAERMKWQSGRDKNKNGHKVLLMNDAGEKKEGGTSWKFQNGTVWDQI